MDWSELVRQHGRALVLYARQWTGSHADAEEVVQEALVRVWRGQQRVALPPERLLPRLYVAIKRRAIDRWRQQRRRQRREERAAELLYAESPGPTALETAERRQQLERALAQLPEAQREVIVMKIWGELTFAMIGEALGISPNTAASRYRYALAALNRQLQRDMPYG